MGKMEEVSARKLKRNQLRRIVLSTMQSAGLLSIAIVAPNVLGTMAKIGLIPSVRQTEVVRNSTKRLIKAGLLEWHSSKLRLTARGRRELERLQLREGVRKPRRWDGRWRVLVFDIPERRKGLRQKIRFELISIGFERLQNSVWVFPYDVEDFITLLKAEYKIGDAMRYMIVETIERDDELRTKFKLPNN